MEISYPGRGSHDKKLEITTMANIAQFQFKKTPSHYWNTFAKRFDGVMVIDAFSDAPNICFSRSI